MTEPPWATERGVPTRYAVRAALHVAATLDAAGSRIVDAHESYWHRATGGVFAPADLKLGQTLLADCGLITEQEGVLYPTAELLQLLAGEVDDAVAEIFRRTVESVDVSPKAPDAARDELDALVSDPARREELLLALGRRFDDAHRRLIGAIGEEIVVSALRSELESLGYPELARAVRHLSLESDQLGYDISAPRIVGDRRLLEVKSTATQSDDELTVYVSRNEAETGLRNRDDWALVVCLVSDTAMREGEILGWLPASVLAQQFPHDAVNGRWESAAITIEPQTLIPGLPAPA